MARPVYSVQLADKAAVSGSWSSPHVERIGHQPSAVVGPTGAAQNNPR